MFVQIEEVDAMEPRDAVLGLKLGKRHRPVGLRVVPDVDREREAQAIILRLVLAERPAELRTCAVMARIGDPDLAGGAIDALVETGLLCRIDEYVLATTAAVRLNRLPSLVARSS